MAERTIPLPTSFVRWLLAPEVLGAVLATAAAPFSAAAATIRRHARQPALPRMSEQWLRTYDADSGHRSEFWRDRW